MVDSQRPGETSAGATTLTVPPVGPLPSVDDLLVCSLLYGDQLDVLAIVHEDDLASPHAGAVLAAIRALTDRGTTVCPQMVLSELMRVGASRPAIDALRIATTAGAASCAARDLAGAVVAAAFRRKVESSGHAMKSAAERMAEADLGALVSHVANDCGDTAARLARLRGGEL